MTRDEPISDAERIRLGLDPLQGERLSDTDDLWRILKRLGHERDEDVPTTVWDNATWTCPLDGCNGFLGLVDTRIRGLPADPQGLDESVNTDDTDLYLRMRKA